MGEAHDNRGHARAINGTGVRNYGASIKTLLLF